MNKNFDFKKSLGQNFLKDENIIRKIVSEITATKDDLIIEIGPGAGAITKHLSALHTNVICFEIDKRLKEDLDKYKTDKLDIIYDDFLKIDLKETLKKYNYKNITFIGNLPYYITTAIINKITEQSNPKEIIIMIQKEVAERFMAKPNTKEYSSISVFLQYNYDIKKVTLVSKECFIPKPKVDSMVIKLTKKTDSKVINKEQFYKLIKDSFTQKRKNLRNNLKNYDKEKLEKILKTLNKDLTFRAEQLSIDDFIEISNNL